jgi:hypothetical protein
VTRRRLYPPIVALAGAATGDATRFGGSCSQLYMGAEVGVPFPTGEDLPTPAARFACNPHLSGKDGGHDINLRQFARQGRPAHHG